MVSRKRENETKGTSSDMKAFYGILIAVALIGIVAVGYSVGSSALGTAAAEPVDLEVGDLSELVQMAEGVTRGDASAPVTIMEFADYQCPACQGFALQVKPQLMARYIDTGQAKFVFHDFPLSQHPHAFLAARAARCADDQDRFWAYHDHLFQNQPTWSQASSAPVGRFVDYAETLGLDVDTFEGCLRSDRHAELVTANMQLGQQLGVPGTPAVFVSSGGMVTRLQSYDLQSIDRAVQEATGGSTASGSDAGGES